MPEDLFGIVGTVIASAYEVESVVAEGGFGIVYRARHGGFRAPVALKCLKVPQHLGPAYQARFLEQFRVEAELMFRLSAATSTVARPLHVDAMTAPNGSFVPFMVLEWLDGSTLDALIRARSRVGKRPYSLPELIGMLAPVALALDRAHHFQGPLGLESIAHCDMKPENVFIANLGGESVTKILDFGVAQVRGAVKRAGQNGDEVALFTPAYAAPEQWDSRQLGETGPWTDVWGLALTLAEALAGGPVVVGDHTAVRAQILDRRRRPTPRTHGAAVSDPVEQVFVRALSVDPRARYADAGTFWRALVEAAGRVPLTSRGPEIPDLVPLARKPSHPELAAVSGAVSFDFDETETPAGGALDLDLPPDEPIPKRSLAPPSPASPSAPLSLMPVGEMPTFTAEAPASMRRPAASPVGTPPSLAPITPRAAASADVRQAPPDASANRSSSAPPASRQATPAVSVERTLAQRLLPGTALVGSSIVLTLLDRAYAAFTSEVFSLGPLRTSWVAAALLLGGVGLLAREIFART